MWHVLFVRRTYPKLFQLTVMYNDNYPALNIYTQQTKAPSWITTQAWNSSGHKLIDIFHLTSLCWLLGASAISQKYGEGTKVVENSLSSSLNNQILSSLRPQLVTDENRPSSNCCSFHVYRNFRHSDLRTIKINLGKKDKNG